MRLWPKQENRKKSKEPFDLNQHAAVGLASKSQGSQQPTGPKRNESNQSIISISEENY
jgi:hypothetical protein